MSIINSHDINIYYEIHGKLDAKHTLVLAHGMGGNAAIWFNQLAEFGDDYRIVTFDHRYFARSSCDKEQFDPAKFPDDINAVLEAEGINEAIFICQSMGGWTGSQMALQFPDKVEALVMSHTPGVFSHDSAKQDQTQVQGQIAKIGGGYSSPALAHDFPEKNLAGAILYQQISAFNGIENAVIPTAIGKADIAVNTDNLVDYKTPTLFITGDKDVLFNSAYIEALATKVPGASCVNLGDVGHSSYFETPDAFNREVRSFLAQNKLN